jgi:Ser/Thr protein kinase RdoA (MazF antagonist)
MDVKDNVIKDILKNWDITEGVSITQVYKSAWDIGGKYILKTGENIAELEKSIHIAKMLRTKNIPVASYLPTAYNKPFLIAENSYFCLMDKVSGVHINPYEQDHKSTACEIGRIIARLHLAFQELGDSIECWDNDFYGEIAGWVSDELKAKAIQIDVKIMDECLKLKDLYYKLPRQIIHRDMHLGNMLFEEGKLSGYIDFDLSQKNVRLFELCYMTLSLLIDNYTNEERCRQWFEIYENIFKGYEEFCPLTEDEKEAAPYMFMCIELLFTAFFLTIGQADLSKNAQNMLEWLYANKVSLRCK